MEPSRTRSSLFSKTESVMLPGYAVRIPRHALAAFFLFTCLPTFQRIACSCIAAEKQSDQVSAQDATKRDPKELPQWRADWRLLWFDHERYITLLRVKMYRRGVLATRPEVAISAESKDPLILKQATEGFRTAMMFVPGRGEWGMGSMPSGELEVITNKDSFKVYFDLKFVLNEEHIGEGNSFVSWTLATAIDELLAERVGVALPRQKFEQLSGEKWLRRERENYLNRTQEAKAR
jgi:hypothetical protein